jgi:ribokinase
MKDTPCVIGCGALNLDLIYEVDTLAEVRKAGFALEPGHEIMGDHAELSRLEDVLLSNGRLVSRSGGGSAANTMCVLDSLGIKTAFAGCVGDDGYGEIVLASMGNVDVSQVKCEGTSSVCVVIIEQDSMDRAMFVAPGSCQAMWQPDFDGLDGFDLLHFSSLAVEEGVALQSRLLDAVHEDTLISFDPGELYAVRGLDALRAFLERIDMLFITEHELSMLDVSSTHLDVLPSWLKYETIMIKKMGDVGAKCITSEQCMFEPALNVSGIVDNTGAGDAFDAGFMYGFLVGWDLRKCLRVGCRIAALSLKGYGRHWLSYISDDVLNG